MPWGYFADDTDPMRRYTESLAALSPALPAEASLGFHLCYGDLAQALHAAEGSRCLRSHGNEGVAAAGGQVDFIHMPVPRNRADDAYFAPLRDLRVGNARTFLGLVHHTDGLDGTLARLATAKRHLRDFGVSTECGLARRPVETLPKLFEIHCRAADQLSQ